MYLLIYFFICFASTGAQGAAGPAASRVQRRHGHQGPSDCGLSGEVDKDRYSHTHTHTHTHTDRQTDRL